MSLAVPLHHQVWGQWSRNWWSAECIVWSCMRCLARHFPDIALKRCNAIFYETREGQSVATSFKGSVDTLICRTKSLNPSVDPRVSCIALTSFNEMWCVGIELVHIRWKFKCVSMVTATFWLCPFSYCILLWPLRIACWLFQFVLRQ